MEQLKLAASSMPEELSRWLREHEGGPLLAVIELDSTGGVVIQRLPDVDPLLIPRVLKSMAQYAEVLRRLA